MWFPPGIPKKFCLFTSVLFWNTLSFVSIKPFSTTKVLTSIRGGLKFMDKDNYMYRVNYSYKYTRLWKCLSIGCKMRAITGNIELGLYTVKTRNIEISLRQIFRTGSFLMAKFAYGEISHDKISQGKISPSEKFQNEISGHCLCYPQTYTLQCTIDPHANLFMGWETGVSYGLSERYLLTLFFIQRKRVKYTVGGCRMAVSAALLCLWERVISFLWQSFSINNDS